MSPQDREYLESHNVEQAIAEALAAIVRERPAKPLQRIAQLISPETFTADGDGAAATAAAAGSGDAVGQSAAKKAAEASQAAHKEEVAEKTGGALDWMS